MSNQPIKISPIDFNPNVAVGLKLPLMQDKNSFFALNYTTFDQVKTNLKNLILTEKGDRYMLPDYGCGLKRFIFESNVEALYSTIEDHIRDTVLKWMPYVSIINIDIGKQPRNENMIYVDIEFQSTMDVSKTDILKIDFYTM